MAAPEPVSASNSLNVNLLSQFGYGDGPGNRPFFLLLYNKDFCDQKIDSPSFPGFVIGLLS